MLFPSCATRIRYRKPLDPVLVLAPGSAVYLKADAELLDAAATVLLSPEDAASLADMIRRTARVTAAAFPDPADPSKLSIEAIAEGKYPAGAASAALSADRRWKREGKAFTNRESGFRVAFADGRVAIAAAGPIDGLSARLAEPGPDPLPTRLRAAWDADAAIFVPAAGAFVAESLTVDDAGNAASDPSADADEEPVVIPLESFLVSAVKRDGTYVCDFFFSFSGDRAARIYAPPCKLALYGLVKPVAPDALSGVIFLYDGPDLRAAGVPLTPGELAQVAASLIFR